MVDTTSGFSGTEIAEKSETTTIGTDGGTIFLHWTTAASMIASLLTGLRISADGLGNSWSQALSNILPQGEMWTWHLLASLVLFFCTVTYFVYVRRAALGERNAANRLRTLTPPTNVRLRWRAINVALHWFAYAAILVLTVSGVLLYIGYGGLLVSLHKITAWAMLFYIAIHSLTHFMYGGLDQLLRLFRPRPLGQSSQKGHFPLAVSLSIGIVFAVAAYAIDTTTRSTLLVQVVGAKPVLNGKLDDLIWQSAQSVSIPTQQGANLGGSGSSTVTVKAVRTEDHIHFAFRWEDPTRSLMRSPTIKRADGWYVMSTGGGVADVNDYYEDKFSVLFSHSDQLGGDGSTFMGKDPLPAYPKSPHGRGLHYTSDGRVMDLWQWKSSRGGMLGHVDDMHFGPPKVPSGKQKAGQKRYAAGYDADPGKAIYEYNYIADGPNGYQSPVRLKRLPLDLAAMRLQLGEIPNNADGQNSSKSQWWMTLENSTEYDSALDAAIPVGTILPSTLNIHTYAGDRADLSGGAHWENGIWTLEVSRKLSTGSAYDMTFQQGTRIYLWASVFDHNQTRHTRHQRPIQLDIQ